MVLIIGSLSLLPGDGMDLGMWILQSFCDVDLAVVGDVAWVVLLECVKVVKNSLVYLEII